MFTGKTLLITGGTGSFGNALVNRFINTDIEEIRILSRDEKKQDSMRRKFNNKKLKFFLGDTRDRNSMVDPIKNVNFVFHAAALKQVPSCEFFPIEAVKTNVLGSENVIDMSINFGVEKVICLSTDKAVHPINAMGMTKALMEKVLISKALATRDQGTVICGTRYGNVMASRGSVIPLFLQQIREGIPITITNPDMTRFMMSLENAIDLVLYAFQNGNQGDIFVQKSPGARIDTIAAAVKKFMNQENHAINFIGERHGEKLHEVLISKQERKKASDLGQYFKIQADDRNLNYDKFFNLGMHINVHDEEEYTSLNTNQLDIERLTLMIKNLVFEESLD